MYNEIILCYTTCPNKLSAKTIAKGLVTSKLAACVNLIPIWSIYLMEDAVQENSEVGLLIKAATRNQDEIVEYIINNHTYQVPAIFFMPANAGSGATREWLSQVCK